MSPNLAHALDVHLMNNATSCAREGMPYSMYLSWLIQWHCPANSKLKLPALPEAIYNKLLTEVEK